MFRNKKNKNGDSKMKNQNNIAKLKTNHLIYLASWITTCFKKTFWKQIGPLWGPVGLWLELETKKNADSTSNFPNKWSSQF